MNGAEKFRLAQGDVLAFNTTMKNYGVNARIQIRNEEEARENCKVFPASCCIYRIQVFGSTSFDNVIRYEKEVRAAIASQRKKMGYFEKYFSIRFDMEPFFTLEVDGPPGFILDYENIDAGEYQAPIGQTFTIDGMQPLLYNLNVHHQTLVAAVSGHGKSQLLKNCVTGLISSTPQSKIELLCIDFKNTDLVPYKHLPHCKAFAFRTEDANAIIAELREEVDRRIDDDKFVIKKRTLLVIDEGAELDKSVDDTLASIMKMGRSLGVHVLMATQHPTAAQIGQKTARAFTHRFVGRVDSAQSAFFASGVADSGAELLRKQGSFLAVYGGQVERFQTFYLSPEREKELIKNRRKK